MDRSKPEQENQRARVAGLRFGRVFWQALFLAVVFLTFRDVPTLLEQAIFLVFWLSIGSSLFFKIANIIALNTDEKFGGYDIMDYGSIIALRIQRFPIKYALTLLVFIALYIQDKIFLFFLFALNEMLEIILVTNAIKQNIPFSHGYFLRSERRN